RLLTVSGDGDVPDRAKARDAAERIGGARDHRRRLLPACRQDRAGGEDDGEQGAVHGVGRGGSGPPAFGPPASSSSPFSFSIFSTSTASPPARDGATVTTIFVPNCIASTDRLRVHPLRRSCAGLGSSSPLQWLTLPLSSVTSKKICACGLTYLNSVTTA